MFKKVFQGGTYVDVFSAQGRDPLSKWRLNGSAAIRKVYEKDVKSYVYYLEGETTTTKISLPKDDKLSLFLIQRYLVLQLYVPLGHSFSLEFGISDMRNNKRRISLSSSLREVTINPLHARFPLNILRLGVWLNLCLDLASLVGEAFKLQTFKAVESLTISANCRLRRIFTMKSQPPDTTDDDEMYGCGNTNDVELDAVPKNLQLSTASEVHHYTQVINMSKIHKADAKAKEAAGLAPPLTPGISEAEKGAKEDQPTHIAFGSKVPIPPHIRKSSRDSGSAGGRSSREGSSRSCGLQHSNSVPQLRSNSPSTELETNRDSNQQIHGRSVSEAARLESPKPHLGVEATQTTIQPRPPRTGSGNKTRRRPVRVRDSNSAKAHSSSASHKVDKTCVDRDESDSCTESISRSQSESSLKFSGNEENLSTSFDQLQKDKTDTKDYKGIENSVKLHERDDRTVENFSYHNGPTEEHKKISTKTYSLVEMKNMEQNDVESNGHTDIAKNQEQQIPMPKISQDSMFTFSSRPRSAPRSPRTRRRKNKSQETRNPEKTLDTKPAIQVTRESTGSESGSVGRSRGRKESERSEYDEDFHKASGESSEDDDLQKFLKSSSNSRSSSRGSRRSPLPSTASSGEVLQVAPSPQCVRASIRSSLLKEIPSPLKNRSYDANNYQSTASSWRNFQSNASSWRPDASMNSSILDKSLNSSFGQDGRIIKEHLNESSDFEESIINNDDGESLTDSSDDTSCGTWKIPPPLDSKQHCYADEMRHPGPEPDLTATLPLDPRVYTNVFSPPIVLPSEKINSAGTYNPLNTALSPPRSRNPSSSMEPADASNVDELDLLYDPCLNCYFDPKSCKYYELA